MTGKYWDGSMLHTCFRHAAWDPASHEASIREGAGQKLLVFSLLSLQVQESP